MSRLPAHVEVGSLLRSVEAAGDFGTILKKGDPERGSVMLVIDSRGRHHAVLERVLGIDGDYQWRSAGPGDSAESAEVSAFLAKRAGFDEDSWIVELDVADPERFIAETTGSG